MTTLAKHYDPAEVEAGLDEKWESAGHYQPESGSDRPPFCICIPPPNVTGSLHMGHALTLTVQDILTRWKRMAGYNALWLPGTDHAGIATQMVVERHLKTEGLSRFDLGREGFLERAFQWKDEYRDRIVTQMRRMGVSVDWTRERFTLDPDYCRAVRKVFVTLYHEGLIYRDHRLVNWSPGIQTVLSDLEIDHIEKTGHLWELKYPVVGEEGRYLTVATTRPETMLGDTAVAVHPEDPRHQDLIGKMVKLPLTDREIPVVGDDVAVDLEFGTGAVKITPAHDFNDFETGKRNNLPMISIFTDEATVNDSAPEKYRGLSREEARKVVVRDMDELGLLGEVKEHVHSVGHCQRTGSVVEPMLSDQWFVKMEPLARPAIDSVREGRIRFHPPTWEKTYFNWMENIRDWCISRQLWWGHQIPVWTCESCGTDICDMEDPTECTSCQSSALVRDTDVLDTWFSSALWPFATLGWPDDTEDLRTFYPNSVMETGFDIIFFWVARMIFSGNHFMKEEPFADVFLHAMVRDEKGEKMSKTKGNVIDPLDIIGEHGADSLRFTLAMLMAQGRDIKLNVDRVMGYRSFCTKIWNASRFVEMKTEGLTQEQYESGLAHGGGVAEGWILTKLDDLVKGVDEDLQKYNINEAASAIYQFTWHAFCDWYVELSKERLKDETGGVERFATQAALLKVLDTVYRLLHPYMPHITEKLWQSLPDFVRGEGDMLIVAAWPSGTLAGESGRADESAQEHVNAIISAIRNIRAERQIPPAERLETVLATGDEELRAMLVRESGSIVSLCRLSELRVEDSADGPAPEGASLSLVAGTRVMVLPPSDNAHLEKEKERLDKAVSKAQEDVKHLERKLGNPNFVDRAPAQLVEKERSRLQQAQGELARYQGQREALDA